MSKFSKRILQSSSSCRNCLVVGSGLGYLPDLIAHCGTVFVIDAVDPSVRFKNVVHRQDFQDVNIFPDIDFIFIDHSHFSNLSKLKPVWTSYRPIIFTEGADSLSAEDYLYFRSESYSLVEIFKRMQKWIPS